MLNSDIISSNTSIYPVIVIGTSSTGKQFLSIKTTEFLDTLDDGTSESVSCLPLLLGISSIKQSIDIIDRKYKISKVTLTISNANYQGTIFSDQFRDYPLINEEVSIHFAGQFEQELIYRGSVSNISQRTETVVISLEDKTEEKIEVPVPSTQETDYFTGDIVPVPMVYGNVDKSPAVVVAKPPASMFGDIDINTLFEDDRHIGYQLGKNIRVLVDYRDVEGYPDVAISTTSNLKNPLHLYENGTYHRVLASANQPLIKDDDGVNLYQVTTQYETGEGYSNNYVDILSRFDATSAEPNQVNYKNLPSAGIVQCIKSQKAVTWTVNAPYESADWDTGASGYQLQPSTPNQESNQVRITGKIKTDLDLNPFGDMTFNNCILRLRFPNVPSTADGSLIYTHFQPIIDTYLWSVQTYQVVFKILDHKGVERHSELITSGAQSGVGLYETLVSTNMSWGQTDNVTPNMVQFEWSVAQGYISGGATADLLADILNFSVFSLYNLEFEGKKFYADVKGRIGDGLLVQQHPAIIIRDILLQECSYTDDTLDMDSFNLAFYQISWWEFAFTVHKNTTAKKLIEDICRSTPYYPIFDVEGLFKLVTINRTYNYSANTGNSISYSTTRTIDVSKILNYSINKTDRENIYGKITINYNKDYATGDYQSTVVKNYGSSSNKHYILDSDYIRNGQVADSTAEDIADFLGRHHRNDHLLFNLSLSISYINLNVGDLVKFEELLDGVKAYGIDYRVLDHINNQYTYPYFMITSVDKKIDSVRIECMQLHMLIPDNLVHLTDWMQLTFPDSDPIYIGEDSEGEEEEEIVDVNLVDDVVIPSNYTAWIELTEAEYIAGNTSNNLWAIVNPQRFEPKLQESFITSHFDNGIIGLSPGVHEVLGTSVNIAEVEDWYSTETSPYVSMRMDFAGTLGEVGLDENRIAYFQDNNAGSNVHSMNMYFNRDAYHPLFSYEHSRYVALTNYSSEDITFTPVHGLILHDINEATANPFEPLAPIFMPGDVNLDGNINVLDIVSMVDIVLGHPNYSEQEVQAADYNQDGIVDILDVVSVVNLILGNGR